MITLDQLNKRASTTFGDEAIIPEQYQEPAQSYNPFQDLANAVTEWIDDIQKSGDRIALAAGNAMTAGVPMENIDSIDDMSLPSQDMSAAQEKFAQALQDAIDDARYTTTKDPLSLAGDVAGAVNPWIPLAVQVPVMAKELQLAQKATNAPDITVQAVDTLLPMLGGGVAASLTHGVGGLLSKAAPKVSAVMTTPFVGTGVAAATTLAMDANVRNYAEEHPARFLVNNFTTDAAIGVKRLAKTDWSVKTNPITNTELIAEKTNPDTGTSSKVQETNEVVNPPKKKKRKKKTKPQRMANVWDVEGDYDDMITPAKITKREAQTTAEKAYPEKMPEKQMQQDAMAEQMVKEHLEARETPEVIQGAYGEKLEYSKENLYPTPVSVEDIWETAKAMFPIRPNHIEAEDGVLGYFMPKGKGIRIRGFRAWSTICHEIGHGLSERFQWGQSPEIQRELYNGAVSIWKHGEYGNKAAAETFLTYVEEGRAAFMNEYCINPAQAQKHFPLAYAAFEDAIRSDKYYQAQMNLLGQQIRKFGSQSDFSKAGAFFHWADKTLGNKIDKLFKITTEFKKAWMWEYADLDVAARSFEKEAGIKIAMENDPAMLAQHAKQAINDVVGCLKDGNGLGTVRAIKALQTKYKVALNAVVATDIFRVFDNVSPERKAAMKAWLAENEMPDFYEAFSIYQTAKHEIELLKTKGLNYKTTHTMDELSSIMSQAEKIPELEQASQLWKKWNENVLRIAVTGQLIPAKSANYFLKTYPEYIPLRRSFEIEGKSGMAATGADTGDFANITGVIKALSEEGSERVIKDPMVQAIKNMQAVISKVERNRVGLALADLADNNPYGHFLMIPIKGGHSKNAERIITIYKNGHQKAYQCTMDGLYEALTSANNSLSYTKLNIISKGMQRMATLLRVGATSTPAFAMWNMAKDILDATILNADGCGNPAFALREPFRLFWQGTEMMVSDTRLGRFMETAGIMSTEKRQLLREMKADYKVNGVQMTTRLGSLKDINKSFREIVNPTTGQKFKTIVSSPAKALMDLNEAMEQIPRMALYRRVKQRGGSNFEAAMTASDGTVNFMRSGTNAKMLNRYIPFFNAVIQGDLKVLRELKQNPLSVMLAASEVLLLPTLVLYQLNKDEDWYRDMPVAKKNSAWYMKIGDTIYVYPKPPLLGQLFGSLHERALDVMREGDSEGTVVNTTIADLIKGLAPSYSNPVIEKTYEWLANYNFYKGRPIVDQRLEKVSPKNQYTPYTSMVARGIGQVTNLSPMKIDNTIYGLTGSMGYAVMGLIDLGFKDTNTPTKKWTEYSRFTYTAGGSQSRSKDVFFNGLDKLEQQYGDAAFDGKKVKVSKELNGMRKSKADAMKISKAIRELNNDKVKDADIKRAELDVLVKKQNDIFRTANKKYLNYKYIQAPK